jgi:uncharacterized protein involved in oxidation of intracellular sulfur
MKILFILNDAPYGNERSYNALRLAKALIKQDSEVEFTLFLMADAVTCAKQGQKPPAGYYNIEIMLHPVTRHPHGRLLLCGTCMDARGLSEGELIKGAHRSHMEELAIATLKADKVLVF